MRKKSDIDVSIIPDISYMFLKNIIFLSNKIKNGGDRLVIAYPRVNVTQKTRS